MPQDELATYWDSHALALEVRAAVILYRTRRDLSQADLAVKLGWTQGNVSRLESGDHEPKWSTLRRLAERLGMTFTVTVGPTRATSSVGVTNASQGTPEP
jgi:transcriptional regulator with XRE-family HTH domain